MNLRVRDLMEPLRVILGAREPICEAALRLTAHRASAAPVMSRGRLLGMVTREQVQNAVRLGFAEARVGEITCGGVRQVRPGSGLPGLKRALAGIAPAVLVRQPRGAYRGVIARAHLGERLFRTHRAEAHRGDRPLERKLAIALGHDRAELLRVAGRIARSRGMRVCLAGGVVRDLLLERAAPDLDLVVEGDGVALARELGRALGAFMVVHETFATARLDLKEGGRIDVATARREVYERPAALPRVSAGSLLDDLLRRDITINSMMVRLDGAGFGTLIDELNGRRDLRARILRVNNILSFAEDPTRAYRAARLGARLKLKPADETMLSLKMCRRVDAFGALSGTRLFREFSRIATEPDPAAALSWCARLHLLEPLGPGLRYDPAARLAVSKLFAGLRSGRIDASADPARMILMILSRRAAHAERRSLARRLKMTGAAAEMLAVFPRSLRRFLLSLSGSASPSSIARSIERTPPEVVALAWALGPRRVRRRIDQSRSQLQKRRRWVTGEMLKELGLPAGPAFRVILDRLRKARLDGLVRDDQAEAAMARRLVRRRLGMAPVDTSRH